MHVAIVTLLLIAATALTSMITRASRVPAPLLQIAVGAAIALAGFHLALEPNVFMLLFIPPLLFADAALMPLRELRSLRGVIFAFAFGLVLFSTLAGGWLVHCFEPSVPLAAAFALAAVLSPTDAVAVGSMLEGRGAPRRMMHILSGESLLNDASGLVCFKFAVLAAMEGGFSVVGAGLEFVQMVVGGAVVGAGLGWLASQATTTFARRDIGNPAAQLTLIALLPFGAYLAAERLGASGILAAVAAGIVVNRLAFYSARPETRLSQQAVWSLIGFLFNGIIFLLLGLQLPLIVAGAAALTRKHALSFWRLPEAILLLTFLLILLRLIWIRLVVAFRWTGARVRGKRPESPSFRLSLAMSVAGVRGAITLAAILSLPVATATTPGFPDRGLLIAVATGVIICSILSAALLLPLLVARINSDQGDSVEREIDAARVTLAHAGLDAIVQFRDKAAAEDREAAQVASVVLADQRSRLARLENEEVADRDMPAGAAIRLYRRELALRLRSVRAQRASLACLLRTQQIDDEAARVLLRELDIEESSLLVTAQATPKSGAR